MQRLGTHGYDSYFSGTYQASDGTRIGYLRIPDFGYPSLRDLDREIQYFQSNTDALVLDVMRNPGGSVCSAEAILSRLARGPFYASTAEIRVGWSDILSVDEALTSAQTSGADADTIAQLQLYQTEFQNAFMNNEGRTKALPICSSNTIGNPVANVYSKPILLLVDEMSASAADVFAGMMQDNMIAPLFGYRTMGAGGELSNAR